MVHVFDGWQTPTFQQKYFPKDCYYPSFEACDRECSWRVVRLIKCHFKSQRLWLEREKNATIPWWGDNLL